MHEPFGRLVATTFDPVGSSNLPDAYLTIRAQITLVPVPVFKRANLREFKVSRTSGRKAVGAGQKVRQRAASRPTLNHAGS
jgi:hypothetical protein